MIALVNKIDVLESVAQAALFEAGYGAIKSPIKLRAVLQEAGLWSAADVQEYDRALALRNRFVHGDSTNGSEDPAKAIAFIDMQLAKLRIPSLSGPRLYAESAGIALERAVERLRETKVSVTADTSPRDIGFDFRLSGGGEEVFVDVRFADDVITSIQTRLLLSRFRSRNAQPSSVLVISNQGLTEGAYRDVRSSGVTWVQWVSPADDDAIAAAIRDIVGLAPETVTFTRAAADVWPQTDVTVEDGTPNLYVVLRNHGTATARNVRFSMTLGSGPFGTWSVLRSGRPDDPDVVELPAHSEARFRVISVSGIASRVICTVSWSDELGDHQNTATLRYEP
ncbi:hypothetical protein GCM10007977_060280 [Dactylosporangium sucinum]|uniref:Uncharacterized protein n=1 Tax=Dactylosporangium sucinum TaxID=1424081 RepID=A0A917U2F1_9ACTN|nr:hypothetical protein GCM10007977_060280 [Dactylosporangium sucinum]